MISSAWNYFPSFCSKNAAYDILPQSPRKRSPTDEAENYSLSPTFRKAPVSVENAEKKMKANLDKSLQEHIEAEVTYSVKKQAKYSSRPLYSSGCFEKQFVIPLITRSSICARQKTPNSRIDECFCENIDEGVIAGVVDALNGKRVALKSSALFQEIFPKELKVNPEHPHRALEITIDKIHKQMKIPDALGASAVFSFIDLKKKSVYTATIGSCEANLYFSLHGFFSNPLSPLRGWHCPKEEGRVPKTVSFFEVSSPKNQESKTHLLCRPNDGPYFSESRALGYDPKYSGILTHKPKITKQDIQPKDTVLLVSPAIKRTLIEKNIMEEVKTRTPNSNLAEKLVKKAMSIRNSSNNFSVVCIHIKKA